MTIKQYYAFIGQNQLPVKHGFCCCCFFLIFFSKSLFLGSIPESVRIYTCIRSLLLYLWQPICDNTNATTHMPHCGNIQGYISTTQQYIHETLHIIYRIMHASFLQFVCHAAFYMQYPSTATCLHAMPYMQQYTFLYIILNRLKLLYAAIGTLASICSMPRKLHMQQQQVYNIIRSSIIKP